MRCKNCGWPNRPGETICSKCGTSLDEATSTTSGTSSPITSNQTVREDDVFTKVSQPNICSKCGYPLRPGLYKCPNCNFNIDGSSNFQPSPSNPNKNVRRPTVIGSPNIHGTINVWTDGAIGLPPTFVLSPIQKNGERKQPVDIEFEGDEVILNRDNTDPGNLSITSRTQAIISQKDGKWYIEDKSDQKTTFVQVSTPHELHDGDIILLGNRLFKFHE